MESRASRFSTAKNASDDEPVRLVAAFRMPDRCLRPFPVRGGSLSARSLLV